MNSIINISKTSLLIAVIIFSIVTGVSYYVIKKYEDDEEKSSKYTILYSLLLGSLFSFISLSLYKFIKKEDCDILTDPFCSKINIV